MQAPNLQLITISTFIAIMQIGSAQEIVNSTGQEIAGSDLTIEYSIGEIVTQTIFSNEMVVTQGFLQPIFNISTSVSRRFDLLDELEVYPVPALNTIHIKFNVDEWTNYSLFSVTGVKLKQGDFRMLASLEIKDLPPGLYFLQIISQQSTFSQTIKIIKQ